MGNKIYLRDCNITILFLLNLILVQNERF